MSLPHSPASMLMLSLVVAGCTTTPPPRRPDAPAALEPPADQTLYVEALGAGAQLYECLQRADGAFEWVFQSPEATLSYRSGATLGTHYAGPTWEALDGSKVVGEVKARDPGPYATALPWLLLSAKANIGTGLFASARSVQRLATIGGIAPDQACDASNLRQVARVPYSATYYFYR